MELSEALNKKLGELVAQAGEFRKRADAIQNTGGDAKVTVQMLIATCEEIGRLNDALKRELDALQSIS